jgi:hypothetical protein
MANPTNPAEPPERSTRAKTDKVEIVVVDFGKAQRKKQVRRLRQGRGKLMARVESLVGELVEAGTVSASMKPVVIVVRERAELPWPFGQ